MPRISEMSRLGRCDLLAALNKHGGLKKVAIALQWTRRSTRRKRESSAAATPASGGRVKVKRRAKYYWSDIERVKSEIGAFVDEFGIKGIMPTQRQFYMFGRSDLVNAAAKHGGLGRLSELMGFQCRRVPKGRLYWRQFSRLKLQLLSFSKANCPGYMPTGDELCKKGGSDIVNAIAAHGGFPHVANLCGLRRRNLHAQGAPVVWHVERLRGELLAFVVKNYPHRAREGVLPTERELRKCGRNDLSYAVKKFGGFRNVARIVGLKVRDKGPFQSANVSSSVTHSPVCGRDIADE